MQMKKHASKQMHDFRRRCVAQSVKIGRSEVSWCCDDSKSCFCATPHRGQTCVALSYETFGHLDDGVAASVGCVLLGS